MRPKYAWVPSGTSFLSSSARNSSLGRGQGGTIGVLLFAKQPKASSEITRVGRRSLGGRANKVINTFIPSLQIPAPLGIPARLTSSVLKRLDQEKHTDNCRDSTHRKHECRIHLVVLHLKSAQPQRIHNSVEEAVVLLARSQLHDGPKQTQDRCPKCHEKTFVLYDPIHYFPFPRSISSESCSRWV